LLIFFLIFFFKNIVTHLRVTRLFENLIDLKTCYLNIQIILLLSCLYTVDVDYSNIKHYKIYIQNSYAIIVVSYFHYLKLIHEFMSVVGTTYSQLNYLIYKRKIYNLYTEKQKIKYNMYYCIF